MIPSTLPPFRAEHIGSLLRPPALLARRRQYERGEIDRAALRAEEDRAIGEAVALQARVGLGLATDGEFRRRSYHSYFYGQLGDITPDAIGGEAAATAGRAAQPTALVKSKVRWTGPIHVDDFKRLSVLTGAVPKLTIPGPCAIHFRGGDAAVTARAYRDVAAYWDDTVAAFRAEFVALADAGCTYVQIDETAFAKFGDPHVQAALAARGDNWSQLIDTYIDITNRVVLGLPAQLRIGMHVCRGNRAGSWHAEGGYDAVAERLFNRLAIRFYFLEYDSPRAGDFAPLRHLPKEKHIVLGLVSTKTAALEDKDALRRRLEAASRYVDIARLSVSPQCGFASIAEGNPITVEAQEAKLRLIVELAHEVWGSN